ncbi:MAG: hopanoid biosynthesis associated transporter like protein HpnN [Hyphomicrobiales bacterium]|nr:hopanoid biosynthesis associated transporter like protein HpnN [Hyphomicrobiales bacterium]
MTHPVERAVAVCIRASWLVVLIAAILTGLGVYVTATRFAINTNTEGLISPNVPWLQNEIAFNRAFPQRKDLILTVIDGETPEIAGEAASRLAAALAPNTGVIQSIRQPGAGPFFEKEGLLLQSTDELTRTTQQLVGQQGLLAPVTADPSLRGVMQGLGLGLQGVHAGQASLADLAPPMQALSTTIERVLAGTQARLSWQSLLDGGKSSPEQLQRFVLIQPKLNFSALQPGADAVNLIRRTASELGLTPERGVQIRLTGEVPLADDELVTVTENAGLNTSITMAIIAVILYLALRSGRTILAVLITIVVGLVLTAGLGLLLVGELNLISVAFAALFVGLGVDFGIQFGVRYRAERHERSDLRSAILAAARGVGRSLTLAAISLIAGFFSLVPTDFRGISELGLIAGLGMVIAYIATITLLPALIAIFNPPGEPEPVETAGLASVDRWIARHRAFVIVATVLLVVAGLPFLTRLRFDSNPMDLRNKRVQSVATFNDLARDPRTTPQTIEVLAPSLDAAKDLAVRLQALPEVARTLTLAAFIPPDQNQKLALIRDAAMQLGPILHPGKAAPAPTDRENVAALRSTAAQLREAAGTAPGQGPDAARTLADAAEGLASAPTQRREAAQTALTVDLTGLLERLRSLFDPAPITRESLPPQLVSDWITADGRARIEIYPEGDSNDNAVLTRFAEAVRSVAPDAVGAPVVIVESGRTVIRAFIEAGILALIAIFAILVVALRRPLDVALTLGPLVLATIMTLEAAALVGLALNFANIIALPLMLAIGVAFHIYYVIAWRAGVADMLASSLTRAIFFSALTTGAAFGSLCFSSYPGLASMGYLLALSLLFTLLAAFVVVPAFLGPPREAGSREAVPAKSPRSPDTL